MHKFIVMTMALAVAVSAQASSIDWGTGVNNGFIVEDSTSTAYTSGTAYLVYLGANGTVDISWTGAAWDMGDDVVVAYTDSDFPSAGVYGDGFAYWAATYAGDVKQQSYVNNTYAAGSNFVLAFSSEEPGGLAFATTGEFGISSEIFTDTAGSASPDPQVFTMGSTVQTQVVPEPGTIMLALAGIGAFFARRRRK